jgi:hypothetical protein
MHRCCLTELTEGVPSAIVQHLMHADQQVRGQEANLITLRPATMEIVPGGEFPDGARGIQLRVRSWPQGNLSAMPHVKWEWLVAPGEWVMRFGADAHYGAESRLAL